LDLGKKARKEREEKRESFAVKRTKQKRKNSLIAAGILGVIAVIVGWSAINFMNISTLSTPGAPPGAGVLGDEHEHASILVRIFADKFDFTSPAFQIKNSWIHFEAQNGSTIHRHGSGVMLGYLFETVGMQLTDECFIFADEREFCNNEDYSLKFYINHNVVQGIQNYVLSEGDRILISYGNEDQAQIDAQLSELDSQPMAG